MPYSTTGVDFDGSNDYMKRGADLTGSADSKIFSGSFWFKRGSTGAQQHIYLSTSGAGVVEFTSANLIRIKAENSSSTKILDIRSSAITDTASWHHCCFSVDLTAANGELWIDDVSDYNENTYIDDTIDFTVSDHAIGANTGGNNKLDLCLADLWLEQGVDLAFGTESNRRKFVTAAGELVDLGANGETPTGGSPIIFCKGPSGDFDTNLGTGGDFTVTGALTDCADDPPSASGGLLIHPGMAGGMREMLGGMRG